MASDDVVALLTQQVRRVADELAAINARLDELGYPPADLAGDSTPAPST